MTALSKRGVKAAKSSHLSACFAVLQVAYRPGPFMQANRDQLDLLLADARANYRRLIKQCHPDFGGDPLIATALNYAMATIESRLKPKTLCETIDFRSHIRPAAKPRQFYAYKRTATHRANHTSLPGQAATHPA